VRIYLAGKMGGRLGHDVLTERVHAARICDEAGIEYIDPARGENIDPLNSVDLSMTYLTMKQYVAKDEFAIRSCDALLVLTGDTPSEGTGWEMGLAHFELHIPIVMVSPLRVKGRLMGFSNIKVDAIFETVEAAVEFLADNYGGKL
jgi:nucleoside 2-deoxyribosyltransferase